MLARSEQAVVPDVKKIAVLRANGIGDFLFALPALEALRAAYPTAELVLLGKAWHAAFLADRPGPVDRVVVVPPSRGVNEGPAVEQQEAGAAALECFFAALQAEQFEIALQLHGGGRYSNPFIRRIGARITVGARTPDAAPLDRWLPYIYYQSEIMRYLEIVSLVGARPTMLEPQIALTEADLAEAQRVLPEGLAPLVVLHPGAGAIRRQWPPAHFAAVGDALAARGARVAVVGTAPEQQTAAAVQAMQRPAVNLCDRLSLGGLAGLLSRCRVVVSNDSGPLHLAAAVGTATVGIYWCGNMITAGHLTRSLHRPVISWRLNCPVCGRDSTRESCEHRVSFVTDVPVADVTAAACDLFG